MRLKQRIEALILGNLDRIEESGQFSVYIDQKKGLYQCNITIGQFFIKAKINLI